MERIKLCICAIITLLLVGCAGTSEYPRDKTVEIGFISKSEVYKDCANLPTEEIVFNSFADVIATKAEENRLYVECVSTVKKTQAVLRTLENGEIIRFTTP
jgi:hypothetical protein